MDSRSISSLVHHECLKAPTPSCVVRSGLRSLERRNDMMRCVHFSEQLAAPMMCQAGDAWDEYADCTNIPCALNAVCIFTVRPT